MYKKRVSRKVFDSIFENYTIGLAVTCKGMLDVSRPAFVFKRPTYYVKNRLSRLLNKSLGLARAELCEDVVNRYAITTDVRRGVHPHYLLRGFEARFGKATIKVSFESLLSLETRLAEMAKKGSVHISTSRPVQK